MKKLKFVLLFFMFSCTLNTFAQEQPGKNHQVFINAKGGIYNHGGTPLGYIDKDNIVRNNKGEKLYFIDNSGNVVDASGKKLGKAKKNGDYFNINGVSVLNTKDLDAEKCAILDPQGHNLGTIHKNYKLHACAAHCFFLEQAKKKAGAKKLRS